MFKQAMTVFIKEMKCIIRDKKTFIFGLLLPLLLVPTMLFIIDFSVSDLQGKTADHVSVAIDRKDNSFYDFFSMQDEITVLNVKNVEQSLDSGEIAAYIKVDENIDKKILNHEDFQLDIQYGNSSINSVMAMPTVQKYEAAYRSIIADYPFSSLSDLREIMNRKVTVEDPMANMPTIDTSSLYFSMLVPMMLILYCCMGSAGTASELSAGEKERGTMEPLLSTAADRTGIIIGKLFATTAMGVTSGLCTAIGLWGYLLISSGNNKNGISVLNMILLLIMTVFISMFFASINLLIGVYSKSYKEAQTYMMPVSLLCVVPTMFSYTLQASSVRMLDLCIPIFNVICIIKEILAGMFNIVHLMIVLGWLILYTALILWVIVRLFKKESIVFRV